MINSIVLTKLTKLWQEYRRLQEQLQQPQTLQNISLYTALSQQIAPLQSVGKLMEQRQTLIQTRQEWMQLQQQDVQLKSAAAIEIKRLNQQIAELEQQLMTWWTNHIKTVSNKNTIMELRAATGGAEASLFVANILNMYVNYFKKCDWKYRFLDRRANHGGGYGYVSLIIESKAAYEELKNEAGVHRVQRVPKTETQGRLHTSTITVAVLQEQEATEFPIDSKDLRIDTFRSSGAGGQSVNTTDSAVRVTHLPTGMMVSCQDGRSQHDNKERAIQVLRARLFKFQRETDAEQHAQKRHSQIGWGLRSEKIRTYNYPQNRITDHRIKTTFNGIETIMNGNLQTIIDKIKATFALVENE